MKTITQLFILLVFILSSCGSEDNKSNTVSSDELRNNSYQEVISLHDEVMPKMQNIISLQEKIKIRIDSLTEMDSASVVLEQLTILNNELTNADKSMMNWMHQFNAKINSKDVSDEVAMAYLEEQKLKILEVQKLMNNSIDKAATYLESHQ